MSAEVNRRIVQRMFAEDLSESDPEKRAVVAEEVFAADFYDPTNPPGMQHGIEGHKAIVSLFARSFSPMRWDVDDIIAEGDRVVVRTRMVGRHAGDFFGISPTGQDVSVDGIHILTLRDGKIVRHDGVNDDLGLFRQLGVVPA